MCVSAEASFGLTGVLIPVGIYCLKSAAQRDRRLLPISALPLLFGIQQFCEGVVWIGLGRGDVKLTRLAALGFLFFALTFWLFWIPFSSVFLEPRRKFKLYLGLCALLGLAGGLILFVPIALNSADLQITLDHHSIRYDYADPPALALAPQEFWHLLYVAVVAAPLFLSKNTTLLWFSTGLVVSAVISHVYFFYAFASIWCFFAALLSLYLCYLFHTWPQRQAGAVDA